MINMSLTRFICISAAASTALLAMIFLFGPAPSGQNPMMGVVPTAAAATQGIQLSLTVSEEEVAVRASVMLRSVVTNGAGGDPVGGASVSFMISRPGGNTTITVTTDKQGVADWKYRAQHEGLYTITATASSAGHTVTSESVKFAAREFQSPARDSRPRMPTGAVAQLW
jgi:hypothetical protein